MRNIVILFTLLAPLAAQAQSSYVIDTASSTVTYHMVHKLHKISAVSKKVEGKAAILDGGKTQVAVTIPVETFDSDNVNRDEHMKEAVEAARFPTVELKALGDGLTPPASFPSTVKRTFKVQLVFHGEKGVFDVPVEITWESASVVKAITHFNISLDAYKIERPSLLFVKVEDALGLDAKLTFKKQ